MTAGRALAETLRRYFHVGPRTRRHRSGSRDLHEDMIEMLETAAAYPGYYSEAQHAALQPGLAVAHAYRKHVDGFRIDPVLRLSIMDMSPYRFAGLLGDMVDAGVVHNGAGERFFSDLARAA